MRDEHDRRGDCAHSRRREHHVRRIHRGRHAGSLIDELCRQHKRELVVIANDTATPGLGIGKLVTAKLVRKLVVSHIGLNPEIQHKMLAGDIEVELVPQGTLVERIRAGGFGLGGVLTPTGVRTLVEQGKRKLEVQGREYLVETPLRGLRAAVGVPRRLLRESHLRVDGAQLQPDRCDGWSTVIAEVEHVVPVGMISPDHVMTPAVLVDLLVARR